jgi:hypothetical protein
MNTMKKLTQNFDKNKLIDAGLVILIAIMVFIFKANKI